MADALGLTGTMIDRDMVPFEKLEKAVKADSWWID